MRRLKLNDVPTIMKDIFGSSNFTMYYEDKKEFNWYLRESIIIASENKKFNILNKVKKSIIICKRKAKHNSVRI